MFHDILVEPEIPPNTGNVIRLCANTGATLHLVEPLGFPLDNAKMRRAGLDYLEYADMCVHASCQALLANEQPDPARIFAFTTRGSAPFAQARFQPGDWLVFSSENRGLPPELRDSFPAAQRLRLPMRPTSRSLNLSNTVAVAIFEAWQQCGYAGGG
ncbi:MAG: tRNA (cytidine(34)-2'-O)-methyltransferase [Candidatus Protistobacter heckmanni]|nr:tRNA (cytidine(34)-2'-O)-methyltransferase [Candidatus Protistobacter heckmanni]